MPRRRPRPSLTPAARRRHADDDHARHPALSPPPLRRRPRPRAARPRPGAVTAAALLPTPAARRPARRRRRAVADPGRAPPSPVTAAAAPADDADSGRAPRMPPRWFDASVDPTSIRPTQIGKNGGASAGLTNALASRTINDG
jgi:hypothetical protein